MEQAKIATGTLVPQTTDGRPCCLSYYLTGVCISNCGRRYSHRTLSTHERGILSASKAQLCIDPHPSTEIATPPWTPGGGSVGNTTLSTRSQRSQGSCDTRGREMKTWQTTAPVATEKNLKENMEVFLGGGGWRGLPSLRFSCD